MKAVRPRISLSANQHTLECSAAKLDLPSGALADGVEQRQLGGDHALEGVR